MGLFGPRLRTLMVRNKNEIVRLLPGDTYSFEITTKASLPGFKSNAIICIDFVWDGKTLTRRQFEWEE